MCKEKRRHTGISLPFTLSKMRFRLIIFRLVLLPSLILGPQQLTSLLSHASSEEMPGASFTYPVTPEGVVEDFVRLEAESGDNPKRLVYHVEDSLPDFDNAIVILNFRIEKMTESHDLAEVKAIYEIVGTTYPGVFSLSKKHEKELIFRLQKERDGFWKIYSDLEAPHVLLMTVLKSFENIVNGNPAVNRPMKKYISILRTYLRTAHEKRG